MLACLLCLASSSALAACDLTFTTIGTTDAGPQKITNTLKYEGLESNGVVEVMNIGTSILDEATKEAGKAKKGESHTLTFQADRMCDGVAAAPEVQKSEGLTWQGVSKVIRASAKAQIDLAKLGDDNVAKGKKTGWGK
jgi:hypothetical protein